MSVQIVFNLVHPFFQDPLNVSVNWSFPFLPKVKESVSPWIWIEKNEFKREQIEELLTEEGKDNFNTEVLSGKFTLENWLYEVGIECKTVFDINYSYKQGNSEIYINLYLNENGEPL